MQHLANVGKESIAVCMHETSVDKPEHELLGFRPLARVLLTDRGMLFPDDDVLQSADGHPHRLDVGLVDKDGEVIGRKVSCVQLSVDTRAVEKVGGHR
jgi:hypothetical protein